MERNTEHKKEHQATIERLHQNAYDSYRHIIISPKQKHGNKWALNYIHWKPVDNFCTSTGLLDLYHVVAIFNLIQNKPLLNLDMVESET